MIQAKKFKGVEIKPFLDSAPAEMGFKQHGLVMHDGAAQLDYPMFFMDGGIVTYITGLNEDGPEVLNIKNEDARKEKILEIRRFIMKCEHELAGNYKVDEKHIADKEKFYEHVHTFRSVFPEERVEYAQTKDKVLVKRYWDKLDIELRNDGYTLNCNNLQDRLRLYIIEAQGYGFIAPSFTVAKETGTFSFYLDKIEETAKENVSVHKERNKAGALLDLLAEKDSNKLFYITKLISLHPLTWRTGQNSSPVEQMYIEVNNFLNGEGKQKVKSAAIAEFNRWADAELEDLKIHCYIEDGLKLGLLSILTDGAYQFVASGTIMGKGKEYVFSYLKAGGDNEPVYQALSKQCESLWKDND